MAYFSNIQTESQLKDSYRKLAFKFHPDRGGNIRIMQMINEEYTQKAETFKKKPKALVDVSVGDLVYVNGTECDVIEVTKDAFKARAVGRNRTAVFDKKTGFGKYNKKFRASYYQYNYQFN